MAGARLRVLILVVSQSSTLLLLLMWGALSVAGAPDRGPARRVKCRSLAVEFPSSPDPRFEKLFEILATRIQERSGIRPTAGGNSACAIELSTQQGIGREGFRIADLSPGKLSITGNDDLGLLYGIGKFLRMNTYSKGSVTLGTWRGDSVPEKPFRAIYFATHFGNYYEEAPIEEVQRYVEDLALWGYNTVIVWFDMHQYNGIDDPAAQAMLKRLNALLEAAKSAGLQVGITQNANEAYANSPLALRADWTAGHDGYFAEPRDHYHVELCPYLPGAKELMLKWRQEIFQAFQKVGLDYIIIWPYDQGGCTCWMCKPWGANGFLTMAKPIAELARRDFPQCKVILSTWKFGEFTHGEWSGLERRFSENKPSWLDYLMADDAGVKRYATPSSARNVPGGLPMLSFPEISMWGTTPWGGFGENPLPTHHQEIWDVGKDMLAGGMPYSEGIFEDFNKVLFAQFFWQKNVPASAVLDEYIAYEFSPKVVPLVRRAVAILERNYPRHAENLENPNAPVHFVMNNTAGAQEAFKLLRQANKRLSRRAKTSWRWRILYLRGLIDSELAKHRFRVSARMEAAFDELTGIYHTQNAVYWVTPPTTRSIERLRAREERPSPPVPPPNRMGRPPESSGN